MKIKLSYSGPMTLENLDYFLRGMECVTSVAIYDDDGYALYGREEPDEPDIGLIELYRLNGIDI